MKFRLNINISIIILSGLIILAIFLTNLNKIRENLQGIFHN